MTFKKRRQPQPNDLVEFGIAGMENRLFQVAKVERYILVLHEFGADDTSRYSLNRGIFHQLGPRWIE